MVRRLAIFCALLPVLGSCDSTRPFLVQGLAGVTSFDEVVFDDSSVAAPGSTGQVDLDALPSLGIAIQKPFTQSGLWLDIGLEAGMAVGWDTEQIAFRSGAGGAVVAIKADMVFLDAFGGPYISKTFREGAFRIFAGGGPLLLYAWANNADSDVNDDDHFEDTSGESGSYVRAGIEFDIGTAGTLGITVQRIDAQVDFENVGSADVDGTFFAVSLTRLL